MLVRYKKNVLKGVRFEVQGGMLSPLNNNHKLVKKVLSLPNNNHIQDTLNGQCTRISSEYDLCSNYFTPKNEFVRTTIQTIYMNFRRQGWKYHSGAYAQLTPIGLGE